MPVEGPWAFGEENPTEGETPVSWQTFSDGEAGVPTIVGDADWGKLQLVDAEEGRSEVYDMGSATDRIWVVTENRYGTGQGWATLQIRGDTSSFNQDDETPVWENYTTPIIRDWRYVQVREIKGVEWVPSFSDGFESGDDSGWDASGSSNANVTYPDVDPRTGTYNAKVEVTSAGGQGYWYEYDLDDPTWVYFRFYVRITDLPAAGQWWILGSVKSSAISAVVSVFLDNNSGTYQWQMRGVTDDLGNTTLWTSTQQEDPATGVWHCVEIYVKMEGTPGSNNGEYRVYINGSELSDISQTGINTRYQNVRRVDLVAQYTGATASHVVEFDDVRIGPRYHGT